MDINFVYFAIALSITLLTWLIPPSSVKKFLKKYWRSLPWKVYLLIAFAFSVFNIIFFYMLLSVGITLETVVLGILMLWALMGIWTPAIQTLPDRRTLHKAIGIAHICFGILVLVLFWITQWPEWRTSALLTSCLVIPLVILLVYDQVIKRKARKSE